MGHQPWPWPTITYISRLPPHRFIAKTDVRVQPTAGVVLCPVLVGSTPAAPLRAHTHVSELVARVCPARPRRAQRPGPSWRLCCSACAKRLLVPPHCSQF
eukprot:scaffold47011_cov54-Phaeocystis_antarctica.AAC.3